jgi:hypothetical protein
MVRVGEGVNMAVVVAHCSCHANAAIQDFTDCPGIRAVATGKKKKILEECADRGFAFVSEDACVSLLTGHAEGGVPVEDQKGNDRKVDLAFACLKHVRPDLDDVEAMKALNRGYLLENPECFGEYQVPADILSDFLTAPESKEVKKHELDMEAKHDDRKSQAKSRNALVHKYFVKSAASLIDKKKKLVKTPRFFPAKNPKTKEATAWLLKHMPSTVSLKEDDLNARWYVINHQGGTPRSISWTRRGHAKACSEVLYTAWTYEWESTGLTPPFDLGGVLRDVEELVPP